MEKHETDMGLLGKSFEIENESKDQMKQEAHRLQDSPREEQEEEKEGDASPKPNGINLRPDAEIVV